eukprot:EG_transcript_10269
MTTVARVTIILRDIPKEVPEEEIRQLFQGDKVQRVNPDIGNTWFVTFETEEDCLAAYEKCQLKCFRDEPLKARIKSENVLNRFVPADTPAYVSQPPPPPPGFPSGAPIPPPFPTMMPGPYPGMYPPMAMGPYPPFPGAPPFGGFIPGPGMPPHMGMGGKGADGWGGPQGGGVEDGPRGGKGGKGRPKKSPIPPPPPVGYEGPYTKYSKEEVLAILCGIMKLDPEGKRRPDLPDSPCVAPEQIAELELCRNGNPGAPAIVEAAITAEDIKPEKTYSRGSGKKQGPVAVLS